MKKEIPLIKKNIRLQSVLIAWAFVLLSFTAKSQCQANFTYTIYPGGNVAFWSTSTGTVAPITYTWNFGDPLSGPYNIDNGTGPWPWSANHLYGSNGTYNVTLSITSGTVGGCTSSTVIPINITTSPCNNPINANWNYTIGAGGAVNFTSTSTGTTGAVSYAWTYGDGGTGNVPNPSHTYASTGNYTVKLKLTDGGCTDSLEQNLNVCITQPSFTWATAPNGVVNFSSTSTGTTPAMGVTWAFGDGSNGSGAIVSHTYASNGDYDVWMQLTNVGFTTCPTTVNDSVSVTNSTCALTGVSFSYSVNAGGNVSYTSTSTGTIAGTTFNWDFGDNTFATGNVASHTYGNGGWHQVKLKVTNLPGCADSLTSYVNVNTIPCVANSNFSVVFSGTPLLWYAVPAYPWNIWAFDWSWGDGSNTWTTAPIGTSHTYSAAGVYSICLTFSSSCGVFSTTCVNQSIFKSANPDLAMVTVSVVSQQQLITALEKQGVEMAQVSVFPNPGSGKLNVRITNIWGTEMADIEVYDVLGKKVHSSSHNINDSSLDAEINLKDLPSGTYYLKTRTNERTYTTKVLISK